MPDDARCPPMTCSVIKSGKMDRLANQCAQRAFTLIELLGVVAILALLIAMLLPALARAKDRARTVVCASNFHQHGLAFQMYANEWNDWICSSVQSDSGGNSGSSWRILMVNEMSTSILMPNYLWDDTSQPGTSLGATVVKARNYKIFLCPQSI